MNISETDLWQAAAPKGADGRQEPSRVGLRSLPLEGFRTVSVRAYTADGGEYVTLIDLPHEMYWLDHQIAQARLMELFGFEHDPSETMH
jgi:hypothetical protein